MSLERKSDAKRLSESFHEGRTQKRIVVFDRRSDNEDAADTIVDTKGLDFNDFLLLVYKRFSIPSNETFVLTTTDRTVLDFDQFEALQDGNTLHLLQKEDQVLPAATLEHINFLPHYNTLVSGGMYEYYASEGRNPLPYALAELIDNALLATAKNMGERNIDIQLLFDDVLGKPAVIFMDNGCGMTSKQLNNWAVYRLSKFNRENSDHEEHVQPHPVPRSLNSDISCFGVGGKQAVFYIGESTRMITKPKGSPDVHELVLSIEDFERKKNSRLDIYSGFIQNRKVGDYSHLEEEDDRFLHDIISEEPEKESFTAVVITGIHPEHIAFLKNDFDIWTRDLAHIYHYYIHGFNGNVQLNNSNSTSPSNVDIQITLREKSTRCPRVVNLREIDNDMQTQYINSAVDTFEFKACTQSGGKLEGVLRYHPFLYDKESYPQDPIASLASLEEDEDCESGVLTQARGRRPIFECYWNGRLIPYTTVSEFDWCLPPKNHALVPPECYSRFSGVLFTDDSFQVSTNKLTFIDMEMQLRNKETIFTRVCNGQGRNVVGSPAEKKVQNKKEQRVKIHRELGNWLKSCHEQWDKQVHFLGFKESVTRTDVAVKKMQHPWAVFSSIKWDNKIFKTGQLIKSQRTQPILYGSIVRFLLFSNKEEDIYATGGQVEISLEPKVLYDECKIIPISKIDRAATNTNIKTNINNELAKLPDKLKVDWPATSWSQNAVQSAGTPLGPIKVEIVNKKGDVISRMPSTCQGAVKKLLIELRVIWHGPNGDQEINSHIAQHSAKWSFWFKAMDNLTMLGQYTLHLNTVLNESNASVLGGKPLPKFSMDFTITEGAAESFVLDAMNSALHVGVPFDMFLTLMDGFGHPAPPPPNLEPLLKCSGLDVSYEKTESSGTKFTILGVKVRGKVENYHCKAHDLEVVLPSLRSNSQTHKISLLPGNPHSIYVRAEEEPITVENGNSLTFKVQVHDEAGNITAQPKLVVYCQVPQLAPASVDCSSTGAGVLVTKPITVRNLNADHRVLKAKFNLPSQKQVLSVWKELRVVPSTRVTRLKIYCKDPSGDTVLKDLEPVAWQVGGVLENLFYQLYDEAGRLVPLSLQMASMIKVNWMADVSLEDLTQGRLPIIKVPTLVETKPFCQLSYKDHQVSVETSFTIVPCPGSPVQLRATLSDSTVKMGETLPGEIRLELLDQYGNSTRKLTSACVEQVVVNAEDLDRSSLDVTWQESSQSVLVKGIRFQPGRTGPRELSFTFRELVEQVKVKVTPGDPAKLELVNGPSQPLQVLNEQGIPAPFILQLSDAWGNPSPDQRVVVALASSSADLKVKCSVMSQPVDQEGKASFTIQSVMGPKGEFKLEFRGLFKRKPIPGPSVPLTVILDPNKPASLAVEYDASAKCPAGGTFPVFSVTVVSDEGGPIRKVNPAALSMFLWRGEPTASSPPPRASTFKCSKPLDNEKDDFHFYFRDKSIPVQAGKYSVQFSLSFRQKYGSTSTVQSRQYVLNVEANDPVKLAPDSQTTTRMVSNSGPLATRVLVRDLTLRIVDTFGNPAGGGLEGQVVVSVKLSPGDSGKALPLLESQTGSLGLELAEGAATVSRLSIKKSCPGHHGSEYILQFNVELGGSERTLVPYELPFRFYNDADNQRQMSELSKKKDELCAALQIYQDVFKHQMELLKLLSCKHQDAITKETILRTELVKRKVNVDPLTSVREIEAAIAERTAHQLSGESRRACSITDPYRGTCEVLGKVCHLALVEDDATAAVISWHIQGDMDCVVTMTTAAAQRIYNSTRGQQQVMPLDSVYVHPNDWPMPHLRIRSSAPCPSGNPAYAREVLFFPQDVESCEKVFRNLLGDTILIDDLISGNAYRKLVAQNKIRCPTILTRQGDRISNNGKFGGSQNSIPPLARLHGKMFGAPPSAEYRNLKDQTDLLRQYCSAVKTTQTAVAEKVAHIKKLKAPEMVKKEEELEAKKMQLREIESQLACTPVRMPTKRALEAEEQLDSSQKRAKPQSQRSL